MCKLWMAAFLAIPLLGAAPDADVPAGFGHWSREAIEQVEVKLDASASTDPHHVGVQQLADYPNESVMLVRRKADGQVEWHETQVDVIMVQSGSATLVVGGTMLNGETLAPHEKRNGTIEGGAHVIGGTSGIGFALARELAKAGADVVPTGRRTELARKAAAEVEALGRRSLALTCDVTDEPSLEQLLRSVCAEFGSVQILVNSAGRIKRSPTLEFSDDEWNAILETNLNGTLRACRVFGRHMIEQKYGRIVNIGSLSCFVGLYEVAAYSASKAGVAALTKTLAIEWATSGVCVNALVPGVVRTDLNAALLDGTERGREFLLRTPMKRYGKVEELGGAAVFLASDAASFVTGHLLVVDGGFLASGVNQ